MGNRIDYYVIPVMALAYGALAVASLYTTFMMDRAWTFMGAAFEGGLMPGFVFLVATMTMVAAWSQLNRGGDAVTFAYVGTGIGTLVFLVQALLFFGDGFGSLIGMEGLAGWTPVDSMDPSMVVGLISLVLLMYYRNRLLAETSGADPC